MKKIILIIVMVLTLLPLFHSGLFDVHDPTSIIRFYTLHETLKMGQFPAAWTNLLNHAYGYPLFLYYAPLFSYLGVILKLVTPSYLLALKLSLGIMVIVSGIGMYRLMRSLVGDRGALLSSVAYTLLPYHASTLYVRGSYAEGMTWALLPWLLTAWAHSLTTKRFLPLTAVVTALFFLSHNSLPFVFVPFLLVWLVIHSHASLVRNLLVLLLGLGLTAWFLLPVIFERGFVQIEHIALLTSYRDHFLTPLQLWHSPWGYGGSAKIGEVDGMSFMLGKLQMLLAGAATILLTWKKRWTWTTGFFFGTTLFFAFMTTTYSSFIWSTISTLSIVQFPWRLIAFSSFGLASLAGYLVEFVPPKWQLGAVVLLVAALLFFNLKFFVPARYISYHDADFLSQEKLDTVAGDKIPEYLPKWMPDFPLDSPVDELVRTPIASTGEVNLTTSGPLVLSVAYMPQWHLYLSGHEQPITPSKDGLIQSVDDLPPGHMSIELTWQRTFIENLGLIISATSLLAMIGLLVL